MVLDSTASATIRHRRNQHNRDDHNISTTAPGEAVTEQVARTASNHHGIDWYDDSTNHFDMDDVVVDNSIGNNNSNIQSREQPPPPRDELPREELVQVVQDPSCTTTTPQNSNKKQHRKSFFSSSSIDIKMDESRYSKIKSRILYGLYMFLTFSLSVYVGHAYICILVAIIETLLFRELVRVRYSTYFNRIQDTIPWFRTTQWMWYVVAISYTYGDFISEVIIQNNIQLHYLLHHIHYVPTILFILYSGTFVFTIFTLQRDHIKFQMNQLCWTMLVLLVTVGQLKYIMHNIFNGLIWYVLPCCLVFVNDIMAYVTGMSFGRKFISRPFIAFSPNKTWEGFIGGWFFTMITAWYLSRFLSKYTWMTCPTNEFILYPIPDNLYCQIDPIFVSTKVIFPSQVFEIVPTWFIKMIFSPKTIIEICSVTTITTSTSSDMLLLQRQLNPIILTPCVSGDMNHVHHHFELNISNNSEYYPIQLHALWLAMFASLVAPFGGFLASAMKRAYGIKDFDSLIPGHGGVMDRMDCQFLMALCTWVHYNTFVKFATISVPKLSYMYSLLSESEKYEFLNSISATILTTNNTTNST